MTSRLNEREQAVGMALVDWQVPLYPGLERLSGRFCDLQPLSDQRHGTSLYQHILADVEGRNWTYQPYGPFNEESGYRSWLRSVEAGRDPLFFAVLSKATGQALGVASLMRINPEAGSFEIGNVQFTNAMQRTPLATEAIYLLAQCGFALGYRRCEWKCDSLNQPSRAAAERLGFTYEGTFRQAMVYKGRNRDTAWYSIVDTEWPLVKARLERWLSADNFDQNGQQLRALGQLR
jgi:RimJ/RimL family protein N-acetyltransferase